VCFTGSGQQATLVFVNYKNAKKYFKEHVKLQLSLRISVMIIIKKLVPIFLNSGCSFVSVD